MVEGARLESVFRGNSNVGSNPTLSAIQNKLQKIARSGWQHVQVFAVGGPPAFIP